MPPRALRSLKTSLENTPGTINSGFNYHVQENAFL